MNIIPKASPSKTRRVETLSRESSLVLIDLVNRRPTLWNPRNPKYKNIMHQRHMWNEIGAEMDMDADFLRNQWTILRGTYRKTKSKYRKSLLTGSCSHADFRPRWYAYEAMNFLGSTTIPVQTEGTLPLAFIEDPLQEQVTQEDIFKDELNEHEEEVSQKKLMDETESTNFVTETDQISSSCQPSVSCSITTATPKRRKMQDMNVQCDENMLEALLSVHRITEKALKRKNSENAAFLNILDEQLSKLSPSAKELFKIEMLRRIVDLRIAEMNT